MKQRYSIPIIFYFLLTFSLVDAQQKTISGKSQPMTISVTPAFERGIPPNLFVDLSFDDANSNGILEANEAAKLKLRIINKGKGPAQRLTITIKDNYYDPYLKIEDQKKIPYIQPNSEISINIPISAGFKVKTAEHKLEINVAEYFGYDMDPAFLILNSLEYQKPEIVFSGLEIIDYGNETGGVIEDGLLQAGELVKVKLVVQNIGNNIAKSVKYNIDCNDPNIYLENQKGVLGDLAVGEVKEFWVKLSPNKRVNTVGKLPLVLTVEDQLKVGGLTNFILPIEMNQRPPETSIVQVKANMDDINKKVARFEYNSNKFSSSVSNLVNIKEVTPSKTIRKNGVAVIFGIENYQNLPEAPFADNDAKLIQEYFKKRLGVEQVVTYTNEQVSGFIFDNVFDPDMGELQRVVTKGETDLFVFYSGHGIPSKDGSKAFLFPYDGRVERIDQQGYDLNKLYRNLDKLGARTVTVFIDACFSGSSRATDDVAEQNIIGERGVVIAPRTDAPWESNPAFSVFASSQGNETSLGFKATETGLFTYFLCAGLQGEADANGDNKISLKELDHYITNNVKITSKKIRGLQSPVFNGNGEMILLEY